MEFSRQEYWSRLPFPSPGDLSDPGIEPWSPALQVDSSPSEIPEKPFVVIRFPQPWLRQPSECTFWRSRALRCLLAYILHKMCTPLTSLTLIPCITLQELAEALVEKPSPKSPEHPPCFYLAISYRPLKPQPKLETFPWRPSSPGSPVIILITVKTSCLLLFFFF